MAERKPPGKGLIERRQRILRSLHARIAWLTIAEQLEPWTSTGRAHEPRPRQTPEAWAAYWERYSPVRYVYPRERPALSHPCDGLAELSEEAVKVWVEGDGFVRSGLSAATQRAMAFIDTFRPRAEARA